jgi:hypothetical protein
MNTPDKQILLLMDVLKQLKLIRFDKDFCDAIGLLKQNLVKIRKGTHHFTPDHMEKVIKLYKVNANWIFGVSEKMFLDKTMLTPPTVKELKETGRH